MISEHRREPDGPLARVWTFLNPPKGLKMSYTADDMCRSVLEIVRPPRLESSDDGLSPFKSFPRIGAAPVSGRRPRRLVLCILFPVTQCLRGTKKELAGGNKACTLCLNAADLRRDVVSRAPPVPEGFFP